MACRKGPRKVRKKYPKERNAKHPVLPLSWFTSLLQLVQNPFWFVLRLLLAVCGDALQPAAWSLCWTVMAVMANMAQAVGVRALLLEMVPFWVPRVAAASSTFALWSMICWFIWQVMANHVIPWARGCRLTFFHNAPRDQALSPVCNASSNDVQPEAELNRHQRKVARRAAARLTAAKETLPSSRVNGGGGGSKTKGSHVVGEDHHAPDTVAKSAAPVDGALNKRQRKASKRAAAQAAVGVETKTATDSNLQTSGTNKVSSEGLPQPVNKKSPRCIRLPSSDSASQQPEDNMSSSTKQGAKKGGGTTSNLSGRVIKSPEQPTTPPQGPLATPPSTTLGSKHNQTQAPRKTGALHPKNSTIKVTGAPSSARLNTRTQLGAPRVNTGRSSPLVGNRVDFATKIAYYIHQGYPEIAKKLQELPQLSERRSTCGDGNCAYRALLMGLLEAAVAADDFTRQSLVQQVQKLYEGLPEWARSSFDGSSNVAHGHSVLMELISHPYLTSEDMADMCCRSRQSNSMLLFLRAVAAAQMATNEDMEMWADPIREALPRSYRNWSLTNMVRSCVLPLAGSPDHELWKWRHGGHAELGVLADALGVCIKLHDVETVVFVVRLGPDESSLNVSLLSTGAHIELVFCTSS